MKKGDGGIEKNYQKKMENVDEKLLTFVHM